MYQCQLCEGPIEPGWTNVTGLVTSLAAFLYPLCTPYEGSARGLRF